MTKQRSAEVHTTLVELEFMLKIAVYIYDQFSDVDLKSGTIHNKLKQSFSNITDVRKHIGKMIFVDNEDVADESTAMIHEINQMIMHLDMEMLKELHYNLEVVTKGRPIEKQEGEEAA